MKRVLHLPTVAEKTFLVTIGDRSVTGMVARDQMVGPWQVPVANCAVTTASLDSYYGEAMAIGERAPVALLDFAASARLAVGEALTNIAATQLAISNASNFPPTGWRRQATLVKMRACMKPLKPWAKSFVRRWA